MFYKTFKIYYFLYWIGLLTTVAGNYTGPYDEVATDELSETTVTTEVIIVKDNLPYMCTLHGYVGSENVFTCGCVIISPNYVLTAAHCGLDQNGATLSVLAGNTEISEDSYDRLERGAKTANGIKFIKHPLYTGSQHPVEYDIALVEIDEHFSWTERIQPITLHQYRVVNLARLTVFGIGSLSVGYRCNIKLYLQTDIELRDCYFAELNKDIPPDVKPLKQAQYCSSWNFTEKGRYGGTDIIHDFTTGVAIRDGQLFGFGSIASSACFFLLRFFTETSEIMDFLEDHVTDFVKLGPLSDHFEFMTTLVWTSGETCSGVIVATRAIVTSGHCNSGKSIYSVTAGRIDNKTDSNYTQTQVGQYFMWTVEMLRPDFPIENDLGVARLRKNLEWTLGVRPVFMVHTTGIDYSEVAYILGIGSASSSIRCLAQFIDDHNIRITGCDRSFFAKYKIIERVPKKEICDGLLQGEKDVTKAVIVQMYRYMGTLSLRKNYCGNSTSYYSRINDIKAVKVGSGGFIDGP